MFSYVYTFFINSLFIYSLPMKSLLTLLFFISAVLQAQEFNQENVIGNFSHTSSFSINQAGFIFVAERDKNEIYKIDTLGTVLKSIGGYGWGESSFDNPADIFATTLNVYVTDKNNNRIQIFDKDLNYLSQFKTDKSENSDFQFAYPECSAVSNQGDLYILDSDNSRILKYGLTGNFLLEIGGNNAGDYSLSNPLNFAISDDGKLFVIDSDMIFVFDQYGTGLLKFEMGFDAFNLSINKNKILLNSADRVKIIYLNNIAAGSKIIDPTQLQLNNSIKEAILYNNKLYVLSETTIHVFSFIK